MPMTRRRIDVEATLEDLRFLRDTGVGATDAARRTGFAGVEALEKWLYRRGHGALFVELKHHDWAPVTGRRNQWSA